jgi:peptide deformylase
LPLSDKQKELIDRMINYIDACYDDQSKKFKIKPGMALAGPQVGLMYNVIYIHTKINEEEYKYLIANPNIVAESKQICFLSAGEGCLSVDKNIPGIVKRKNKITIDALDLLNNETIQIAVEGVLAICFQHEIDHLNGILYYDRINKSNPFYKEKDWIEY